MTHGWWCLAAMLWAVFLILVLLIRERSHQQLLRHIRTRWGLRS